MRQRPDRITGVLVTILYVCFANKNLGAIRDVTFEHARLGGAVAGGRDRHGGVSAA